MSWMFSIWVATALLVLCRDVKSANEGIKLAPPGYHLCIYNETRSVTYLALHIVPHSVTKGCGGWLFWTSCPGTAYKVIQKIQYKNVTKQTTRCCDGYVQIGRYCASSAKRTEAFAAKPGSCPTADGSDPTCEDCEWDIECPGSQKCCQRSDRHLCSPPARSASYSQNGGYRLNATITVKVDYDELMSKTGGHLNHTRLLQAMVTGALESDISVYYLASWPVHPYRTATSLLIECKFPLSPDDVAPKLYLLLKRIQEVSSVTVEDVDECAHPVLRQCSIQANCCNTVGSYKCSCRPGYVDLDPSNPGANCTADVGGMTTTELPSTRPPMSTHSTAAPRSTQTPQGIGTMAPHTPTETSMTTALSHSSAVTSNESPAQQWTSSSSDISSSPTVESPPPMTTCSPPSITSLWSVNVTGTSFSVCWSSRVKTNQTYQVFVCKGTEVLHYWETNQTMVEVTGLQPGVLYNVTVTPIACGSQGNTHHASVRTDARTLDATTRLTNIQFTADLQNESSQAYKNLTETITAEIYQRLTPDAKAMVDSDQMRIEIRGYFPGSVVLKFAIVFTPSQSQDISNVSQGVLTSLRNSSKFTVDEANTSIKDFDECASGEDDCSQWATCENTWASFICVCLDGFMDINPERPGRTCVVPTPETTTPTAKPSTLSTTPLSQTTMTTNDPDLVTENKTPWTSTDDLSTASSAKQTGLPVVATTYSTTVSTTTSAVPTTSTNPTTTITTTPTPTTTQTTTSTFPTTTTTQIPNTTNSVTTTTTFSTPMTEELMTITDSTIASNVRTTTTTNPTITTTQIMTTAPTTTSAAPTTTTTNPTTATTSTSPKPTTVFTTYSTTPSTSTTPGPITSLTTKTMLPITTTTMIPTPAKVPMTTNSQTTMPTPTTNSTNPMSSTDASGTGAISVQCSVAAITVMIARDFLLNAKIRDSDLYLGSQECGVNGDNTTHVQLTVAWNECDTRLVHNETHYMASVILSNNMDQYTSANGTLETPRIRLEVPVMCGYLKNIVVSADFSSMGHDMFKDVISAFGWFQVTVRLMNGTVPLPHNYSLSPDESVVVDVSLNTSSEHIKVIINKCWATPTKNPADAYSSVFLENSCAMNVYTNVLTNGNSSTSRLSVQIFSFVKLNVIYLHCQVQICAQIGSETCVPDCLQRTARTAKMVGTAVASSGPLFLSEEEPLDEINTLNVVGISCLGVGLTIVLIAGFFIILYCQRNRIGHYNFNVKPKQENFTYLHFNT
ncbi:uromodulin-like 1 [Antennarius striatus]|uniref:uromodulin-like 1 n=1 Tax=Antennarius striatus TaxID=241820 RepID=UPI0035B09F19